MKRNLVNMINLVQEIWMKKVGVFGLVIIMAGIYSMEGAFPKKWELYRFEQFLKGKFTGISVA